VARPASFKEMLAKAESRPGSASCLMICCGSPFAVVRESGNGVLGIATSNVQLTRPMVLHEGQNRRMKRPAKGKKTLVANPAGPNLNALHRRRVPG